MNKTIYHDFNINETALEDHKRELNQSSFDVAIDANEVMLASFS